MDSIIKELNPFGKYQKLSFFLISLVSTLLATTTYCNIFITAEPNFTCEVVNNTNINITKIINNCEQWSNWTSKNSDKFLDCHIDNKYYGKTIVTDWNLFCDRNFLNVLSQTLYLSGSFIAAFTGFYGDKYGRKRSVVVFLWLNVAVSILTHILTINAIKITVNTKFIIYCIGQVFKGTFVNTFYASAYVLLLEGTIHDYNTIFSNVNVAFYVCGELIALLVSYLIKDWENITWFVIAISVLISITSTFFIDEGARWLVSQGRYDDAYKILQKIARINNKEFKLEKLDAINTAELEEHILPGPQIAPEDINGEKNQEKKKSIKSMLKGTFFPKRNFFKTIVLTFVWLTVSLLYYGKSFGITRVDSINPYILFISQAIAELIGYWLTLVNDRFGRRRPLIVFLLVTAVVCLIVSLIPRNKDLENNQKVILDAIGIITLISIAKCTVSAAYVTCYVYTTELYTTNVRNFALLFCSCFGNIGALVAPQVNSLGDIVWKPLPFLIFSIFAFFASFAIVFLPESKIK